MVCTHEDACIILRDGLASLLSKMVGVGWGEVGGGGGEVGGGGGEVGEVGDGGWGGGGEGRKTL